MTFHFALILIQHMLYLSHLICLPLKCQLLQDRDLGLFSTECPVLRIAPTPGREGLTNVRPPPQRGPGEERAPLRGNAAISSIAHLHGSLLHQLLTGEVVLNTESASQSKEARPTWSWTHSRRTTSYRPQRMTLQSCTPCLGVCLSWTLEDDLRGLGQMTVRRGE